MFPIFLQPIGTYDFLKSVGLGLRQNGTLRSGVPHHYEYITKSLISIEGTFVNRIWNSEVKPQMMEKFSQDFFFGPAVPHGYQGLMRDAYYRSTLTTFREAIVWKDRSTRVVVSSAENMITDIQTELNSG